MVKRRAVVILLAVLVIGVFVSWNGVFKSLAPVVGLILPTLLSWPGSSLTLDIKGENWALTSGWRKSQGHTVLRFDPTDASGSGCAFNPLDEIRLTSLEVVQDVQIGRAHV